MQPIYYDVYRGFQWSVKSETKSPEIIEITGLQVFWTRTAAGNYDPQPPPHPPEPRPQTEWLLPPDENAERIFLDRFSLHRGQATSASLVLMVCCSMKFQPQASH